MKTSSFWGPPPSRFYTFIRRVESSFKEKSLNFGILGCSDGKFVLPLARRSHRVLAIDIDETALYGGQKEGPDGAVHMAGLMSRLHVEGLERFVDVRCLDFVELDQRQQCHGVFSSGAIQYSRNLRHDVNVLIASMQSWVMPAGYFYLEYMMPFEEHHFSRPNFLTRALVTSRFDSKGWIIHSHRTFPPKLEHAHVDNPVDHFHKWGYLLAQRRV